MSDELLDCVEVGPAEGATASVVWLHGLGADGHDFEPIVPELGLPDGRVRFIFPHAPVRPVTLNGGMAMRAWYDLYGLDADMRQDRDGLGAGAVQVERLLTREQDRGVPAERTVLAGFSQGGALALHTGLRYPQSLAGIMGLSTYLPLHESVTAEAATANAETPLFLAHGTEDPVLPFALGDRSRALLESYGYRVEWHEYPMQHQVCLEEIRAIGTWLSTVLAL